MKIIDIIKGDKPSLSFEVFPPKNTSSFDTVRDAALAIADLSPSYMSVTYGAGGSTDAYTGVIAESINNKGVTALAHLSCIASTREGVLMRLSDLRSRGIENILALRGDLPEGATLDRAEYRHASELAEEIRAFGGFCIGGACYPEGHPESVSEDRDIEALSIKVECGCEFLTTQMFFDNAVVYRFMDKLLARGITVPIVPGIMPVTSVKQIARITGLSGGNIPKELMAIVERNRDDEIGMREAGVEYATRQIEDLYKNGFNAVHVYSMNKPDVARAIRDNLKGVIG